MPNFTQRAIKATFIKLLEERPLKDITVKDIVEACGINRNSFYYHYQDLPTLIEEIIKEEADEVIMKYPSVNSVVECFDALVEFASKHKTAIMHIYRSINRDVFERYLMDLSLYFVQSYINIALDEKLIKEEDKDTIVNYYKCIFFGMIIDWLNTGMKDEYIMMARKIFRLKKDMALEIAELLENQI